MASNSTILHVFIPKDFKETYQLFLEELKSDKSFEKMMTAKSEVDKRIKIPTNKKSGNITSMQIRYAILYYIEQKSLGADQDSQDSQEQEVESGESIIENSQEVAS